MRTVSVRFVDEFDVGHSGQEHAQAAAQSRAIADNEHATVNGHLLHLYGPATLVHQI
jgi:hypothetical protein